MKTSKKMNYFLAVNVILIVAYFACISLGKIEFHSSFYYLLIIVLNITAIIHFNLKMKKLKKELNINQDLSFEELKKLKIEKDYHQSFVKNLDNTLK